MTEYEVRPETGHRGLICSRRELPALCPGDRLRGRVDGNRGQPSSVKHGRTGRGLRHFQLSFFGYPGCPEYLHCFELNLLRQNLRTRDPRTSISREVIKVCDFRQAVDLLPIMTEASSMPAIMGSGVERHWKSTRTARRHVSCTGRPLLRVCCARLARRNYFSMRATKKCG
jgi:hypothetical protein